MGYDRRIVNLSTLWPTETSGSNRHYWAPLNSQYTLLTISYKNPQKRSINVKQLTVAQLVKKLPAIYEARSFSTVTTTARHVSLSWARTIQSTSPHIISLGSILISSAYTRLSLSSGPFMWGACTISPPTHTNPTPRLPQSSSFHSRGVPTYNSKLH